MLTNREYLLHQQYRNASNLESRIELHRRFSTNPDPWFRWVFNYFNLPRDARILEVGTGPGDLWRENQERLPKSWQIILTDLSKGMLFQGRGYLRGSEQRVSYVAADAQDLPFPSNRFDAVIANHMLYHIPDLAGALAEITRVLRLGGRIYAATNGNRHMQELYDLVNAFLPGLNYGIREYTFSLENGAACLAPRFSQVRLLRYENGLRVTEVEPLVAYVLSMSSIYGHGLANRLDEFHVYLQAEMDRRGGEIFIRKDVGLFVAEK